MISASTDHRSELITSSRIASVAVLLALCAGSASAAPPVAERPFKGTITCAVETRNTGYRDLQTHTWQLTGRILSAPGATIQSHEANWSVTGSGDWQYSQGNQTLRAQWTTKAAASGPISFFVRASDNMLVVKSSHGQLRVHNGITGSQQVTIGGVPQTPKALGLEAFEWDFPIATVAPSANPISGRTSATGRGPGPMQPGGSVGSAKCDWRYGY